jgi:hypothetical protein
VTAQDVGREFSCFKCNASLIVLREGIQLADAPRGAARAEAVAEAAEPEPAPRRRVLSAGDFWGRVRQVADVPTWVFGAGALLVIIYLFFPLINLAKVERAKGALQLGQIREDRMERELKQKKDVTPADEELRKKARESWVKEKERLEDVTRELGAEAQQSNYWYTWGMMFGFLLLAAAALGYLNPAQPTIRRVVGAIVIVAEVLLIFIRYVTRI